MMEHYYFSIGFQWIYWLLNVVAFCIYASDKRKAIYQQRRIPEVVLLLFAFIGGALGALSAMLLFRHKTKHPKFYITVPILLLLQLLGYGYMVWVKIL